MGTLFGLCDICGGDDLHGGEDGFFYCSACGSQSQQFQEQLLDYEALASYTRRTQRSVAAATAATFAAGGEEANPTFQPGPSSQAGLFGHPHLGYTDDAKPWETHGKRWPDTHGVYGPQEPLDPLETMDDEAATVRKLYIEGLQEILQIQCEVAVQKFQVSPLICGIVGPVWLRFIAFTRVFEKDWAKEVIQVEEARKEQRRKKQKKKQGEMDEVEEDIGDKPLQMRRALCFLWLGALKERIPLSVPLALVYLACHIAREPILPTDIVNWALEGTLPYLAAFCQVEKKKAGLSWPIEARLMFKPADVIGARKLEFMAASIAKRIGLQLPPVNFHAISCRLLKQLNLPVEKLSGYICRFYDWYTPSGLWLSDEVQALPSRVYVMAMVMVTLKVLYKVDGRWYWGKPMVGSGKGVGSPSDRKMHGDQAKIATTSNGQSATQRCGPHSHELGSQDTLMIEEPHHGLHRPIKEATQKACHDSFEAKDETDDVWSAKRLLEKLEKSWQDQKYELFDYKKDLGPYLKYCQDVVFSGLKVGGDDENMCDQLWRLYEQPPKKETFLSQEEPIRVDIPEIHSLSGDSHFSFASSNDQTSQKDKNTQVSSLCKSETEEITLTTFENKVKNEEESRACKGFRSLEELIHDMEELGFSCLPPRKQPLTSGKYLRYVKKKAKDANAPKVLHADYFILLCACAKVISVQPIALYWCVQRVENCLRHIEGKAKYSNQTEVQKLTDN